MTRSGVIGTLVWAVLAAIAAIIVARAHYTTDLSAFLPRSPTANQRLLVDQLRDGLASRLIIVAIEGADSATRARISTAMARRLRADPQFAAVSNGGSTGTERDREFLFKNRYLLSEAVTPERFTVTGLKDAIQDTIDLLASPAGLLVKDVLPHDPTGEIVQIVAQVSGGSAPRTADGVWVSGDGKRALIVAQTHALGSDTDGQQRAVEAIRGAFGEATAGAAASKDSALGAGTRKVSSQATDPPQITGSSQDAHAAHVIPPVANTSRATGTPPAAGTSPAASQPVLVMSGPGVFAVTSRANIIKEVTRLSILSTAIIVALLLGVYRSVAALVLGLVPVASGAIVGIAAVAVGVGVVHGITLGFGVTLIGEAVDYSIYLFIQSRQSPPPRSAATGIRSAGADASSATTGPSDADRAVWQRSVWPTIRLGMLTSVCGFASLLPSGFAGLAQLGLYSIAGLIAAALVTRFVLPHWLPRNFSIRDVSPIGVAISRLLQRVKGAPVMVVVLSVAAAAVLYLHRDTLWNRELSALSPVSLADQDLDAQLRVDIHAPDVRYLVVVSAPDEESALAAAEKAGARLDALIDSNVIGGFDSPAHYLPSAATQRSRQNSIPLTDELRKRLGEAVDGLPVRIERLQPFLADAEGARTQPLLTRRDLANTSLASGFDALLTHSRDGWIALLPLRAAPQNPSYIDDRPVRKAVEEAAPGRATLLDIKGEADSLYSTYLSEAVRLSLAGFAAIVILLLIALRSPVRVARVVLPLALAVLVVAGGFALFGRQLTILHVIGMLLIVAVGSNYALFFDRRAVETRPGTSARQSTGARLGTGARHIADSPPTDAYPAVDAHPGAAATRMHDPHPGSVALTLASLLVANIATVVSFGILAFSSVPVLSALGSTVAPGALLALVFSALLARHLPTSAPTRAAVG